MERTCERRLAQVESPNAPGDLKQAIKAAVARRTRALACQLFVAGDAATVPR